jgi:hypothetical protein
MAFTTPTSLASERIARKSSSKRLQGRGCCNRQDLREPRRAAGRLEPQPFRGWEASLSSLNRDHMFETKQWQKPARRSHASSCCSSFTTSSATIDTCQFRLENCPRSLRSSCRDVDRVTASSVGRSRRHWGKPPRMPLGLTGQGAYTSSAGPRGGLTFWVHSEISGRSAARTR